MFERRHGFRSSEEFGTLPSVYTASVQPLTNAETPSTTAIRPARRVRALRFTGALRALFTAFSLLSARAAAASDVPPEAPLATVVDMTTLNPCFDRIALTRAIEQWLERSTVDARLLIHVSTDEGIPSFSIRLGNEPPLVRRFVDRPGDCESERDAIALSIALAIDSLSSQATPIRQPIWNIGASGLVTTAWSDRVNWGSSLSIGARVAWHFEPQLGFAFAASRDQSLRASSTARLQTRIILARASGCWTVPVIEWVTALACGGLMGGPARISASGLVSARTETHLYWAATGTVEIRLRFTRSFGIHLAADVLASLRRGTLQVDDADGEPFYAQTLPPVLGVFPDRSVGVLLMRRAYFSYTGDSQNVRRAALTEGTRTF